MIKALLAALVTLSVTVAAALGATIPMPGMSFSDRDLVRTIAEGGANIKYYRQNNKTSNPHETRICLINMTPTPKSMVWTRTAPYYGMSDIVAEPNGGGECVSVPINRRIEWDFVDGTKTRTSEAMSLGGFANDLVAFEWTWTRADRVRECQEQRCNVLAEVGVANADNPEVSSQYGIVTLLCLAFCEVQ
jgi:hypothetical protein